MKPSHVWEFFLLCFVAVCCTLGHVLGKMHETNAIPPIFMGGLIVICATTAFAGTAFLMYKTLTAIRDEQSS